MPVPHRVPALPLAEPGESRAAPQKYRPDARQLTGAADDAQSPAHAEPPSESALAANPPV